MKLLLGLSVVQVENGVPKDRHQRYLNNGHHTAAIDTITSKCIKKSKSTGTDNFDSVGTSYV